MTPGRLIIGLVLLLVTTTTLGAVVVHGERDRRTTGAGFAVGLTSVPDAPSTSRPGPTASAPRAEPRPTPARTPKASGTPKASRTPKATRTDKPKPTTRASGRPAPTAKRGTVVYLTFDDGPGPYTPQVLKVLRQTGSTATFFQLGVNARGQQHVQAAIRAQGSNIGNHSWNHPDLTRLSAAQLRRQIADGPRSGCFRPPYGATNASVRAAIARAGAHQVLWTVDSRDWTRPGVAKLERLGRSGLVHGGSIVLMHDGGGDRAQTVAALPGLIRGLQSRGFVVRALPSCG